VRLQFNPQTPQSARQNAGPGRWLGGPWVRVVFVRTYPLGNQADQPENRLLIIGAELFEYLVDKGSRCNVRERVLIGGLSVLQHDKFSYLIVFNVVFNWRIPCCESGNSIRTGSSWLKSSIPRKRWR
jgi:hypothetical protein